MDEMVDGVKKYAAIVVYKVKFAENAEDYSTKGENIEFKTPSIAGTIAGLTSTEWKDRKIFDSEKEAEDLVKGVLNITDTGGTETPAS